MSILFADLVGFTTRSESADPEHVREFLARYFDLCRDTVERYGGTVEKFIGDAVMAVWGTPIAQEDDAERAVRAALDLVDGVRRVGRETADEDLALRAAVLTGEAAVAIGATNQGMVAGDLVNTASRLQSVAPPGTVLVGEGTYRIASRAIVFEEVGAQLLKGKTAPVQAWRALRVVAERGGLGRSEGIEAPFVGRDDELRLLKDILHATSRERRIRLVSVTGEAGIGKSRLAWEYLKYIDGLLEGIFWHQGRSPAFGDGVTFWALGEMIRRRAKLAEMDDEPTTRARIADTLAEYVPNEQERPQLEPTLLSLLGIGEPPAGGRDELFAALRTFFERVSIQGTTVLVFEDLQWADAGVLDFIDHMLEWSIGYPILLLTLARPELLDRRPGWGAGRRDLSALSLGPLPEPAMRELLSSLVPDLPERTMRAILDRADGIPLYAVEIIRMLVADDRLAEAEGTYRVVGDLGDLRVPASLQALIAARLDALVPADRALLQDGAVLGQTFGVPALAALTGDDPDALETRLRALVRREVLQFDTDPRSPERGQYGFTQALVRDVAYGTLSKRDRRTKHLAAARHFESLGDEEVAGVLATHYIDAWAAAPDGPEGEAVAAQARIALRSAADRATGLGSHEQAIAFLERARQVTTNEAEVDDLLERIGVAQRERGRYDDAIASLRTAIERHRARGDLSGSARATADLAVTLVGAFRTDEALAVTTAAVAEFESLGPDPAAVLVRSVHARSLNLSDSHAEGRHWADIALADAERLDLVPIVADAFVTKGSSLAFTGRWREGTALLESGLRLALANGLYLSAARAANNLGAAFGGTDPVESVKVGREGIALARRYGFAGLLVGTLANTIEASVPTGEWSWIDAELDAVRVEELDEPDRLSIITGQVQIEAIRGRDVTAMDAELVAFAESGEGPVFRSAVLYAIAVTDLAAGRYEDALDRARRSAELAALNAPNGYTTAGTASILLGDVAAAHDILERLEAVGARGPALTAEVLSLRAGTAGLDGRWPEAGQLYQEAWRRMRDLGLRFSLARSQLELVSIAPAGDRLAITMAAEAREIFEQLGARAFAVQLEAAVKRHGHAEPLASPADSDAGRSVEDRTTSPA